MTNLGSQAKYFRRRSQSLSRDFTAGLGFLYGASEWDGGWGSKPERSGGDLLSRGERLDPFFGSPCPVEVGFGAVGISGWGGDWSSKLGRSGAALLRRGERRGPFFGSPYPIEV